MNGNEDMKRRRGREAGRGCSSGPDAEVATPTRLSRCATAGSSSLSVPTGGLLHPWFASDAPPGWRRRRRWGRTSRGPRQSNQCGQQSVRNAVQSRQSGDNP